MNAWKVSIRLGEPKLYRKNSVLNDQGEVIDIQAFDAKRFVRAFLFLSIIAILMAIIKPSHAAGTVALLPSSWSVPNTPIKGGYLTPQAACDAFAVLYSTGGTCTIFSSFPYSNYTVYNFRSYSSAGVHIATGQAWPLGGGVCPANSTGTTTCTCTDPHVSDPTRTSCVLPACPAHASGAPCACDAGYQFDAAGTSCVSACPVPALTAPPFNDACAEVLENIGSTQAQKDAACGALTPALLAGKACLEAKLAGMSPPIPMKITGDIRSVAYQAHLREIWDKMETLVPLMKNDPAMQTACAVRRAEIAAEKGCDNAGVCTSCYSESATQRSHCLKGMPAHPSANDAQHTQGNAIDASEILTIVPLKRALKALNPPQTIPQFLDAPTNCNLIWGGMFTDNYDPVHFLAR